jgi:hypothetical protein
MTTRARLVARAVLLLVAPPMLGCFAERERLDVPVVHLTLDSDVVVPGDTIRGRVIAADRSGLIGVSVYGISAATTPDSIDRASRSLIEQDSIDLGFTLVVSPNAPVGSNVRVSAVVFDNQNFSARADTIAHVLPARP